MAMSAQALALISLKSAEHRSTVKRELVKLLASDNEVVRQRAAEALRDMAAEDKSNMSVSSGGGPQLVKLLKEARKP